MPPLIYNFYQLYVSDPTAHESNAESIKDSVESVSGEPKSFGRYILALRVNGNLQQPVHILCQWNSIMNYDIKQHLIYVYGIIWVSFVIISRQTSYDSGNLHQDYRSIRGLPMNHTRFVFIGSPSR